jgi:hypothetical protein
MACRSTTGTPEGFPCSTYGSFTRPGSSTDFATGAVVRFIDLSSVRRAAFSTTSGQNGLPGCRAAVHDDGLACYVGGGG